ncbi:hypothetical protein [Roseibium sediminis]|uniref:hypothetical protein n=1 Tax=Roseibium sediminis TaxID=1775174 RepID=UPI00123CE596|nr:hypothetical protein [Roseibium sediminis]
MANDPTDDCAPARFSSLHLSRWGRSAVFALVWSLMITALAAFQLTQAGRSLEDGRLDTLGFLAVGSFLGAIFALVFTVFVRRFRPQTSARFAAMFIGLTMGTVGFSAFLHFLDYRSYYASWHSSTFKYWVGEQIMTGAGSLYIFLVHVTPLLMPWGVVLLLGACAFEVRRSKNSR